MSRSPEVEDSDTADARPAAAAHGAAAEAAGEPPRPGLPTGTRLLITGAAAVVVIAGVRAASGIIVPILLAGVLSLLCSIPLQAMRRRGVPAALAILAVLLVMVVGVLALVSIGGAAADRFAAAIPRYAQELTPTVERVTALLQDRNMIDAEQSEKLARVLEPGRVLGLVSDVATAFLASLSDLFVIALLMGFMLAEGQGFGDKMRLAFPRSRSVLQQLHSIRDNVAGYMTVKTAVSLGTGLLVAGWTAMLGLESAPFWGILAFLFNFIPNIGSIIAAVPAVLVALLDEGPGFALLVAGGYLLINFAVGNLLEPRLMGRRVGLSTLVVFVSLLFWNFVFGPIGMLLSVPLTVVLKVVFEHIEDLRPVAVLLGPSEPAAGERVPEAAGKAG